MVMIDKVYVIQEREKSIVYSSSVLRICLRRKHGEHNLSSYAERRGMTNLAGKESTSMTIMLEHHRAWSTPTVFSTNETLETQSSA